MVGVVPAGVDVTIREAKGKGGLDESEGTGACAHFVVVDVQVYGRIG